MPVQFDHLVVLVRDLDVAVGAFADVGLLAQRGGVHAIGTHNAVIPLSTGFIELVAIHDRRVAAANDEGRSLMQFLDRGEGPIGYAVSVSDLDAHIDAVRRVGLACSDPVGGLRTAPDGSPVRYRGAEIGERWMDVPWPFLIEQAAWADRFPTIAAAPAPILHSVRVAASDTAMAATVFERALQVRRVRSAHSDQREYRLDDVTVVLARGRPPAPSPRRVAVSLRLGGIVGDDVRATICGIELAASAASRGLAEADSVGEQP